MDSNQLTFVQSLINEEINAFTKRRNYNRNAAFRFGVVVSALSALTTILIGSSEIIGIQWLGILALIASGFVTVVSTWENLFQNRKLWTLNNSTLAELYELKIDIEFRNAESNRLIKPDEVQEFYDRYKKIARTTEEALKATRSS